jgi:hypothetical protein
VYSYDSITKAFSSRVTSYEPSEEQGKLKVRIGTINPRNSHLLTFCKNNEGFFIDEEDNQLRYLLEKKVIDAKLLP